jgi:uncharacterized damage-inducible protein DinB
MTIADLNRMFDYCYWANQRLFEVLAQLSPEQFTQTVAGSYGSVRNTLVHVLSAEWGWLDRCGGPKRGSALKNDDYPSVGVLVQRWKTVEEYMRTFLTGLADADLERNVGFSTPRGENWSMPLGELLHHAAVHGVHHRGQVALLLRLLGYAPGNFGMLLYYAGDALVW